MLDNIYDKSELKKVIDSMPEQVREAYNSDVSIKLKGVPANILICGMGGFRYSRLMTIQSRHMLLRIHCS